MTRISKKRLAELDHLLSERDKAILRSLEMCRYLTTGQIQRLHFTEHANPRSALNAADRGLTKLLGYGLLNVLKRRIGGVRAGSGAKVWLSAEAGARLLHISDVGYKPQKRLFEPTVIFLEHTLAVSETYVQLNEVCARYDIKLTKAEPEPVCWRGYTNENGKSALLKPDLFAVTVGGGYEDNWFLEVDLATESPSVVMEKCRRYALYYKTGAEQRQSGVFPLVVWIVPSLARKDNLKRYIAEYRELRPKNIFLVITPDEFEALILGGAEVLSKKKGATA